MKQKFIIRDGNPALKVIFGGWGSSPELFSGCEVQPGNDFLLCYDYKDMDFDWSLLEGYDSAQLLAWSMGVWAAGRLFTAGLSEEDALRRDEFLGRCTRRTAFGGTPFPIDDEFGIPVKIFEGTLSGMSVQSLYKFRRRMCGSDLGYFQSRIPERSLDDLVSELSLIGETVGQDGRAALQEGGAGLLGDFWTDALVGSGDLIFPPENQKAAWSSLKVPVRELDAAHYDHRVFEDFLSGGLPNG